MKYFFKIALVTLCTVVFFFSCQEKKTNDGTPVVKETLTAGTTTMYVDRTVQPVIEDVLAVFHSIYKRADIIQVNKNENEIIAALMHDSARVVVLPRMLTGDEQAHFEKLKITPKVTAFAMDAVALIAHKDLSDTVIELDELFNVLKGDTSDKITKIVFDNPNSSTIQYLLKEGNIPSLPSQNVYALSSNEDVIKYVHDNKGAIGIVGVNWLLQPPRSLSGYVENVSVLAVDNVKKDKAEKKYYKPNQSNIATGSYPLTRTLYVLNYQGKLGLGMGFATYISAREGQRIILKSGLMPIEVPYRELNVRSEL